jgi:ABC-2 type transport system ATP-binding protein
MKKPLIKVEKVKKAFADNKVLDSISFEVYSDEIFGIIGPSGGGKTTFLNVLIGFLPPDTGNVLFRDENIFETTDNAQFRPVLENIDEVKRKFGFAAQTPSFYTKLTVFENLDYFGALYNLTKEARLTNINTLLDLVELENARDVQAKNLSGGMQRRLDIACALIHDPDILVLDEPTSDLDPMLARHIWNLIQKINKRGTTIVVASHDLGELESVCHRIGILSNAKIEHIGNIHELTNILSKGQEIHLETYPGNYEKLLKSLHDPLIIEKENRGNQIVLHTAKPQKVLSKLLTTLSHNDETLVDLSITKISLRDVFSKVTKRK